MGDRTPFDDRVFVRDVKQDVVSRCDTLPYSDGVKGGIVCHGYFDIEKLIFIREEKDDRKGDPEDDRDGDRNTKVLLLEKKLPFQLLIVRIS